MLDNQIDFTDYKTPENVQEFLNRMKDWIELNNIEPIKKNEDVERLLSLSYDEIKHINKDEALAGAYILFGYAHYVQNVLNREKAVLDWSESSVYYIVSDKLNNYGDGYTKWEQKYYSAVKENPLAREIFKLKTHCLSRVNTLNKTVEKIERQANILEQIARAKI